MDDAAKDEFVLEAISKLNFRCERLQFSLAVLSVPKSSST
jgi:hypothetical protein